MPKFRKRPVVIEAEQFFADQPLPFSDRSAVCWNGEFWYVTTAHGQETKIVHGDWIIPEPDGRGFYPCKDDIFRATYEPAEREAQVDAADQAFAGEMKRVGLEYEIQRTRVDTTSG